MPMKTQQLLPEVLEMDMRKWFKEAQYGMMAHWGLYSLLGGEWNGKKSSSYAEWIQANQRIPMAEYDKLATAFNPVYFNADQWIRLAKECGMKYFVTGGLDFRRFSQYIPVPVPLPDTHRSCSAYQKHHHGSADRPGNDKRNPKPHPVKVPAV